MVYAVDTYNPSIADFNIYDKLFLQGFASVLHLLLPEPADVDKGQLIGRAKMWGMWTPIFQHRTDESGLQLVVAESAAGMRWMRADEVWLIGQPPLLGPKLPGMGVYLLRA